jgi:cellulose synthase/poly-beta-1,6-N-acetylglucosamine synthase-like glycosyltransferase
MEPLTGLLSIYVLLYAAYLLRLLAGYGKVPEFSGKITPASVGFSIVVPLRNEAGNLPVLLESIAALRYPFDLFEVIFIDDGSTDDSSKQIYAWRMQHGSIQATLIENVRVTGSPKKDAISRAMPIAVHDWIVTTDADCGLPGGWLQAFNDYIGSHDVSMLAAPVAYRDAKGICGRFQLIDFLALQGATIGGFGVGKAFMCNGANFAYRKSFFQELKGFAGNDQTAGGDDVFLLQKAVGQLREKVHYLKSKDAIVTTQPARGWRELVQQRVRWASKTAGYQSDFAETLAWVVLLGNLSLVALWILVLGKLPIGFALAAFLVKSVPDWLLALRANRFLRGTGFFFPVFTSILYPAFAVLVAILSGFGKYRWKGRGFKA